MQGRRKNLSLDRVFSRLLSQGVYGGKILIDPDKLQEFDTAIHKISYE